MKSIKSPYRLSTFVVACLGLVMCSVSPANDTVTIINVDGTSLQGELLGWTAEEMSFRSDGRTLSVPSPKLLRARWHRDKLQAKAQPYVELTDGTRLPHNGFEVEGSIATIVTTFSQSPIKLSTEQIEYVQLSAEVGQLEGSGETESGDVLVVRKKDSGAYDYLTGIIGDISAKQVSLNWDGELIPVRRAKVAAFKYFHSRRSPQKEAKFWLHLDDGGQIPVNTLSLENGGLEVRTPSGLQLSLNLNALISADYSQGKLVYLSDIQPLEQQWVPRIALPTSAELVRQHGLPRRDQAFAGSPLSLRWLSEDKRLLQGDVRTYDKGLALRSRTVCRYRVPKGMRRFVSFAGIDPATSGQGNVTLELMADERTVWQGEIDGSATPAEINVGLDGVRELLIVVDYGENLDFGDRLHLAEARFSK